VSIPWTQTLVGLVLGYVGGGIVDHPKIGAVIGAAAGYVYGGGQLPQLPNGQTPGVLNVPTTTITPGPTR
jgi:hypothetical protein